MKDVKIGLETHLQLFSDSKLFCGCPTSGSDGPNTRVCPTCLGMPGSKPRVNRKVIEMGIKIAEALDCEIADEMFFSRKNYFYPDMPKNYQITQYEVPLARAGKLTFKLKGEDKEVRIRRIHLEEDPGKIKHVGGDITSADYVLVDYNRSGVPLCEIVTEPDLRTPEEARIFLNRLVNIFEYLKVYDSSSEASVRSDANISMGGERIEVKNITGQRGIEKAMSYEIRRQENLRKRDKEVERETRSFDDASGVTRPLRKKEVEEEYGYIFEPDLTKINLSEKWIKDVTADLPELPHEKKGRYIEEFGLPRELADTICSDFKLTEVYEEMIETAGNRISAKLLSGPVKKVLNYNEMGFSESELTVDKLLKIIEMLEGDEITERNAEMIIRELATEDEDPEKLKEERGLGKVSGEKIKEDVMEVVKEEESAVEDYRSGKGEALNYLMGKVMEKTGGSADPNDVRTLLRKELGD